MQEPHTQQDQPPPATAVISLDRDLIVVIERTAVDPLALVEKSTRIRRADLETISTYEAADQYGGWLVASIDPKTADICDYLISDVMGGAQAAVHIARRFATARVNVRQKETTGDFPDFLHDPKGQSHGEDEE